MKAEKRVYVITVSIYISKFCAKDNNFLDLRQENLNLFH